MRPRYRKTELPEGNCDAENEKLTAQSPDAAAMLFMAVISASALGSSGAPAGGQRQNAQSFRACARPS